MYTELTWQAAPVSLMLYFYSLLVSPEWVGFTLAFSKFSLGFITFGPLNTVTRGKDK